jgi:hypothetical protein
MGIPRMTSTLRIKKFQNQLQKITKANGQGPDEKFIIDWFNVVKQMAIFFLMKKNQQYEAAKAFVELPWEKVKNW